MPHITLFSPISMLGFGANNHLSPICWSDDSLQVVKLHNSQVCSSLQLNMISVKECGCKSSCRTEQWEIMGVINQYNGMYANYNRVLVGKRQTNHPYSIKQKFLREYKHLRSSSINFMRKKVLRQSAAFMYMDETLSRVSNPK